MPTRFTSADTIGFIITREASVEIADH
jgi:hypothetical protein